jgi:hypothetical protein
MQPTSGQLCRIVESCKQDLHQAKVRYNNLLRRSRHLSNQGLPLPANLVRSFMCAERDYNKLKRRYENLSRLPLPGTPIQCPFRSPSTSTPS